MMSSESISDEETGKAIWTLFTIIMVTMADPHGAVGWLALNRWLENHPGESGIFLETAHPVKFPEIVEKFTGHPVNIPESVSELFVRQKNQLKSSQNTTAD